MYEILSYMPEDMSFNCRKCYPVGCPEWEMTLKRELRNGLENILNTLILSKSSQYIYKYEQVCIIQIFEKYEQVCVIQIFETWWPSGRASDSIYRCHGFKPHQ